MNELLGNFWFWFVVITSVAATSIVAIIAYAWQMVRRAEAEAGLKRTMLERGLSVDEMERLLQAGQGARENDDELVEQLASRLAGESVAHETIQQVMEAFHAADAAHRRLLYRAIFGLSDGYQATDAQVLAIVRGLCGPHANETPRWQPGEAKFELPVTGIRAGQ